MRTIEDIRYKIRHNIFKRSKNINKEKSSALEAFETKMYGEIHCKHRTLLIRLRYRIN